MLRERSKNNKMVQRYKLPTEIKMNSKHYDRVDVDTFLYTRREGIGTTKEEKKENERDNVLVILCSHRYCKKREKKGENIRDNILTILGNSD